jgi:hypothetical protein|nr:MAG TPA: minor tail protein [Caudoviricetes sp.]
MSTIQTVTIKYVADTTSIKNGISEIKNMNKQVSDVGDKGKGSFDKLSSSASGAKDSIASFGAKIGISASIMNSVIGALQKGAQAFAGFAKDSVSAASDFDENMNKTLAVFGDAGQRFIDMSGSMATAMGMSKNQYLESISLFGAIGKAMDIPNDQLMTMSENLTGLATDLGSFYNKSTEQAMTALKGALTGETEALKEFGIVANETTMAEFTKNQGKAWASMTAGEKAIARYQYIMQQTGFIQGDFARTSDGLANSQKQLEANMENLKVAIGAGLVPVFADITTKVAEFVSAITMSDDQLAQSSANTQQKIDETNAKLQALADQGITTGDEVDNLKGQLEALSNQQVQTDKIQEMKSTIEQWKPALEAVAITIGIITGLWLAMKVAMFALTAVQTTINILTGVWAVLSGAVSLAMAPIEVIALLIVAAIAAIILVVWGVIEIIQNWGAITDWLWGVWQSLCDWFASLPSKFWEWFDQAAQWCKDAFNGLWDWFKNLDLLNMLFGALKNIGQWLNDNCLQPIINWFKDIPSKVGDAIKSWGSWIGDTVKGWFGLSLRDLEALQPSFNLTNNPDGNYGSINKIQNINYNIYTKADPNLSFIANQKAIVDGGQGYGFNNNMLR